MLRQDPQYFAKLSKKGHVKGRRPPKHLRPSEMMLMAAGRYKEAADAIYSRAYGAGWIAGRNGRNQARRKDAA